MINKTFPGTASHSRSTDRTLTQSELQGSGPKSLTTGANHNLLFVVSNDQHDIKPLQEHLREQGILDEQRIIHVSDPAQLPRLIRDHLNSQSATTTINNIGIISSRENGDLGRFIIPELTEIIATIKDRVRGIYLAAKDSIPLNLIRTSVPKLLQRLSVDESSKLATLPERIKAFTQLVLHGEPKSKLSSAENFDPTSVKGYSPKASPSEVLRGSTKWGTQALGEALAELRATVPSKRYLRPEEVQNSIFKPNTESLVTKGVKAFTPFVDKVFQLSS
jgi:hypothetical protein